MELIKILKVNVSRITKNELHKNINILINDFNKTVILNIVLSHTALFCINIFKKSKGTINFNKQI